MHPIPSLSELRARAARMAAEGRGLTFEEAQDRLSGALPELEGACTVDLVDGGALALVDRGIWHPARWAVCSWTGGAWILVEDDQALNRFMTGAHLSEVARGTVTSWDLPAPRRSLSGEVVHVPGSCLTRSWVVVRCDRCGPVLVEGVLGLLMLEDEHGAHANVGGE